MALECFMLTGIQLATRTELAVLLLLKMIAFFMALVNSNFTLNFVKMLNKTVSKSLVSRQKRSLLKEIPYSFQTFFNPAI